MGTIKNLDDRFVTVEFSTGLKRFGLPNAFAKSFLRIAVERPTPVWSQTESETPRERDSKGNLYDDLVAAGFNCVDNRSSSSIIWVLYRPELSDQFEGIVNRYNAQYKLERRGAMATGGRAAWRIMA